MTMHQKWMCWFFKCMSKKGSLKKNQVWSFFSSLLSSSSLPQFFLFFLFIAMGPCLFLPTHLLCLSHHKTPWTMLVDNVGLKICPLGTSNSRPWPLKHFFSLGVNRSAPKTSSTTYHKVYMALGRLHGAWGKHALSPWSSKSCYIDYPNQCVLLFGVTQHNNNLLGSSICTNESSIGYLDIIDHPWLCFVKHYIHIK